MIIIILLILSIALSWAYRRNTANEIADIDTKLNALTDNAISQQAYARLNSDANREMLKALTAATGNQVAMMQAQDEILRRQNEQ